MNKEIENINVAVVGVSQDTEKFGYKIFRGLLEKSTRVYAVGVRGGKVLGNKIFRNVKELPVVPDLVITVVPPIGTEAIVEQAKEIGVKEIWMQPGSSSKEAIEKAEGHGIKVTHHACYMKHKGIW